MSLRGTRPRFTAAQRTELRAWYRALPYGTRMAALELRATTIGCSVSCLRRYVASNKIFRNHQESAA